MKESGTVLGREEGSVVSSLLTWERCYFRVRRRERGRREKGRREGE